MSHRIPLADRVGAACGAAYILLILVGNQMATGASSDPHPSGAKDLADFAATPSIAQTVGFTMEVTGFLAFMFFLGWLVQALRQRGGSAPWLAGTAGIAGAITLAVKLASVMPILAAELDHRELTPTLARLLSDMNGAAFVVTFLPYGVFVASTGMAFLATGFLGRVAGWSGVAIGALTVLAALVSHIDPVNTNVMPFMAGLLWLLVIGVRLAWRGGRPTATQTSPLPVPAVA